MSWELLETSDPPLEALELLETADSLLHDLELLETAVSSRGVGALEIADPFLQELGLLETGAAGIILARSRLLWEAVGLGVLHMQHLEAPHNGILGSRKSDQGGHALHRPSTCCRHCTSKQTSKQASKHACKQACEQQVSKQKKAARAPRDHKHANVHAGACRRACALSGPHMHEVALDVDLPHGLIPLPRNRLGVLGACTQLLHEALHFPDHVLVCARAGHPAFVMQALRRDR
eukprot:363771-Chlamydomonas_euryale.AAC.8